MTQFLIYVPLEDYLAQWFIHEQGGEVPVRLTRGSVESKILEVFLVKRPDNVDPDLGGKGKLAVMIPEFRYKPASVYNHLPKHAVNSFIGAIRSRFDIKLWQDLHQFGNLANRHDELIYAWMESNGIEMNETNWNAIAKRYQRQRMVYLKRERSKKKYSDRKNV